MKITFSAVSKHKRLLEKYIQPKIKTVCVYCATDTNGSFTNSVSLAAIVMDLN